MSFTNATTILPLFCPYSYYIWLGIVCEPSWHSSKCKKWAEGQKNCCLKHLSIWHRQMLKKKAFFWQESCQLQDWLLKINDKMTNIKNLKDEIMSFQKVIDNDNLEAIKSSTNNLTLSYYFIFFDENLTLPNHLVESNKLLAFFKSIV